jgi:hypothetical protein
MATWEDAKRRRVQEGINKGCTYRGWPTTIKSNKVNNGKRIIGKGRIVLTNNSTIIFKM